MESAEHKTEFQVERLAFFSDAVFAIAITLLALEIHPAHAPSPLTEHNLRVALVSMLPKIIGFVVSFAVVGTYWRAHHRLFRWVRNFDSTMMSLNLLLLLTVSFIPCPTAFFSTYYVFRTPLIFYAVSLSLVGLAHYALWTYTTRRPTLIDPAAPPHELRIMGARSLIIPVVCLSAALASLVSLTLARTLLIVMPLFIVVYTRRAYRRSQAPPTEV